MEILQKALNAYLSLDPETEYRLKRLQDKIITLELLGLNWKIQLIFLEKKVQVISDSFFIPHTTIRGTPLSLLHMTLTQGNRTAFFSDDISIEGDLELGQHIMDLFDQLEIDWEEYTSHVLGDTTAHYLGNTFRNMRKITKRIRKSLLQNINEYIHEEIDLFPGSEALRDFFSEVDILRMEVDRAEARLISIKTKKRGDA